MLEGERVVVMNEYQVKEDDLSSMVIEQVMASSSAGSKRLVYRFNFRNYTWRFRVRVGKETYEFECLSDAITCYNSNATLYRYGVVI